MFIPIEEQTLSIRYGLNYIFNYGYCKCMYYIERSKPQKTENIVCDNKYSI